MSDENQAVHQPVAQLNSSAYSSITARVYLGYLGCTSLLFRCLPGPVNFLGSVRCKETQVVYGRLGMAHNATFHQLHAMASSMFNSMEGCKYITGWMEWEGEQVQKQRKKKRTAYRKNCFWFCQTMQCYDLKMTNCVAIMASFEVGNVFLKFSERVQE